MKNKFVKSRYILLFSHFILCSILISTTIFSSMDLVYDLQTAKVSGMGGSNVSNITGADSIFYNWASTGEYLEFKLEQASIIEDNYYIGSIQNPFHISKLKLGFLYQSVGDLEETSLNSFNQPQLTGSTFNHFMIAFFSAYNSQILNTNIGLRHTLFYESIKSEYTLSNQFDLALLKSFTLFNSPINYGINVKNIFKSDIKWSTGTQDPSARIVSTGLSGAFLNEKLSLSIDRIFSFQKGYSQTSSGIEYFIFGDSNTQPYMILRGGICKTELSMGTSINLDGWIFDYAYSYVNPFSNISSSETIEQHRFSIGKSLKPFSSIKAKLEFNESRLNTLSPYQLKSILPTPTPTSKTIIKPKTLVEMKLSVNVNTNKITLTQQKLDTSFISRLNFSNNITTKIINESLPIKWIAYKNSEQNMFMLDLESTQSNKLHLSGYIPSYLDVYINGELVTDINSDNSFYKKIIPSNNTEIIKIKLQSNP